MVAPDAFGRSADVLQVGAARRTGWRADGDEYHIRVGDGIRIAGRESQIRARGGEQVFEVGLVDGSPASFEGLDFAWVRIEAGDLMPEVGQAHAGGEPYISGADDRDFHIFPV